MDSKGMLYALRENAKQLREEGLVRVVDQNEANEMGLMPVDRELSHDEKLFGKIHRYSPCGCGSGKKFKFCCGLMK